LLDPNWEDIHCEWPVPANVSLWGVAFASDSERVPINKEMSDRHLVLGQRPGFVSADDRRRAQGFHSGEMANQGMPSDHARDTQGERNGDDGW
jgi:hypothetical protein